MVGLITGNDETACREEVRDLSLNVIKTKEMIVDYSKRRAKHAPILIDRAVVEQVESFKFLVGEGLVSKQFTVVFGACDK